MDGMVDCSSDVCRTRKLKVNGNRSETLGSEREERSQCNTSSHDEGTEGEDPFRYLGIMFC